MVVQWYHFISVSNCPSRHFISRNNQTPIRAQACAKKTRLKLISWTCGLYVRNFFTRRSLKGAPSKREHTFLSLPLEVQKFIKPILKWLFSAFFLDFVVSPNQSYTICLPNSSATHRLSRLFSGLVVFQADFRCSLSTVTLIVKLQCLLRLPYEVFDKQSAPLKIGTEVMWGKISRVWPVSTSVPVLLFLNHSVLLSLFS